MKRLLLPLLATIAFPTALTITPSTLTAENLTPKESHTKQTMPFLNNDLSDGILIAKLVNGCEIKPKTNCSGANLKKANLRGANLVGSNLKGANLEGANLIIANLFNTNLKGANLKDAKLKGANLRGANLEGANLSGAKLNGANLIGANLMNAYFDPEELKKAIR